MPSAKRFHLKRSIMYGGVIYAPGEHILPPDVFAAIRTKEGIGYVFDEPADTLPPLDSTAEEEPPAPATPIATPEHERPTAPDTEPTPDPELLDRSGQRPGRATPKKPPARRARKADA